jgi:hypothetical protein
MNLIVVLPVSRPDFHLAVQWLRWAILLRRSTEHVISHLYPLIVVPAASVKPEEVAQLVALCEETVWWQVAQQAVEYEHPELGYAAAANGLFKAALEIAEARAPGKAVLWAEADTVPTRVTWFNEIEEEYAECGKPFMGAFHAHGPIPHMSGNAVYPPNWRQLAPSLAALPGPKPEQGWDSACAHETVPQMAIAETIQQVWIAPPFSRHNVDRILKPKTALFHRCKDGTLVDVLAERYRLPAVPLQGPICAPTSIVGEVSQPRELRVTILIVTYAKDIPFLRYCLASIKKYATGFSGVTLVVPAHERSQFDWVRDAFIHSFDEPPGKGMLAHLIQKTRADLWCPDADFVLHIDSDCMFFRKVTPADYVIDSRCLSVREAYSGIANPNRHIWRECVKNATGIVLEHDYMLRHPQIHPLSVYRATREFVESFTGQPFEEFVLNGRNEFPQTFCEFNTLSAVGRRLFSCCYHYVEYDRAADAALCLREPGSFQYVYKRESDFLVEWWSHGGIDQYKSDCDAVLAGRVPAYWIK